MQFTPQQMAGGISYSHGTRIGNWNEDSSLQEGRSAAYQRNKQNGTRLTDLKAAVGAVELAIAACTCSEVVRFGDTVQLQHGVTGAYMASNLSLRVLDATPGAVEIVVSAHGGSGNPVARNTFVVLPKDASVGAIGEPLCYGHPFRLVSAPGLARGGEDFVLLSRKPGLGSGCTRGMQQAVCLTHASREGNGADSVWSCALPSGACVESLGELRPVPVDTAMLLRHNQTGKNLAADAKLTVATDYGQELAVSCHSYRSTKLPQMMIGEFNGSRTGNDSVPALANNNWKFVAN